MASLLQPFPRTRVVRGAAAGSSWEVALRTPPAALRPYVRGDFVGYTERSSGRLSRKELPGPFVVLIFEFGPPVRVQPGGAAPVAHRGGFVAGLDDRYAITEHDGFQQGVQVYLTPLGARRLFGIPMSELTGLVVPVQDVLPKAHRSLSHRLAELSDWESRLDLVEDALLRGLAFGRDEKGVVSWAWRQILETGGNLDVRVLARSAGYSHKHLIALFRDQVGLPPKQLSRLVRFDRLVQHVKSGGAGTWAELAVDFGFYDQSHLVREVKHFAGVTPTQLGPLMFDLDGLGEPLSAG